ncbi:bacillithiol system redox-active protein YtxJ [Paenibacillus sp. 481]|uniref:bacillithiol system redox-active protein YtxJ n=1 Tax=Paenibacillus sp. 481 TaxID=2835869 RepID=UPI001E405781|nr:bacillithiol system redox-active protein YtxJ [Paenibacillus sp. 481]UHA74069.1 bacillithiol system redox-active protein YtxJ [Paenibacillus sp. 481]
MKRIQTLEQLQTIIAESHQQPVVLFKHSTRCPVSSQADEEMDSVVKDFADKGIVFGKILVVEERPVSLECAEQLGIKHESPQVLLLQQGNVIWHDSHYAIRYDKVSEKLTNLT